MINILKRQPYNEKKFIVEYEENIEFIEEEYLENSIVMFKLVLVYQ